jgi:hypothetical protein
MKDKKFNAKEFLNAKVLSPLEEEALKGGTGAAVVQKVTVTVVTVTVKQQK